MAGAPLAGHRVLLVEDEALVAIDLEATLQAAGAEVMGPFLRLSEAMTALKWVTPDVAIVDIVPGRDESHPLIELLTERDVPVVLHSGHAAATQVVERHASTRLCLKPCSPATIVQAVARAVEE